MNRTGKFLTSYFGAMGLYGSYRGYYNMYGENSVLFNHNRKFGEPHDLLVDNVVHSLLGAFLQVNPIMQPAILYDISRRWEKYLRGQEINQKEYDI